jgi:ubiquinone/menaquinone biosynthesis C-methylase UbiE
MWELYRNEYWFCNCSEGILGVEDGEQMECVAQMPLNEAIEQVKKAWVFEKQDDMTKVKQMYDHLYKDSIYFPKNGIFTWISFLENENNKGKIPFKKGLDVGCGAGAGMLKAVDRGFDVYGIDIASNEEIWKEMGLDGRCSVAPAHEIPYPDNEFDFVMCSDVMEHVPESYIDATLKEILRVGSGTFLFAIAMKPSSSVSSTVQTHYTMAPPEWWADKINDMGYKIIHFQPEEDHHVIIGAIKNA